MKNFDKKHLSLESRNKIQEGIEKRLHKVEIAKSINKSISTVTKEITKHRKLKPRNLYNDINNCIYLKDCKVCISRCSDYKEKNCLERDHFVGACNNCPKIKRCKLDKYFYKAKIAHEKYIYNLKDSREGINLTTSELITIAHIIKPLINQWQSLYTILENHPEINLCSKTLYTYIEMGLFRDCGITNLSLKRKVKRRIRNKSLKK